MLLATLSALALAIVGQDQVALRAGPDRSTQQQAVLWQGDALEVRGEKLEYLQVYDHRRERAGYVQASQVRVMSLEPADAPELLSIARFLRDVPGAETLGIAYVAAYLKAAPAKDITAEPFAALGVMADRLALRASSRSGSTNGAKLAAQLEIAQSYGVTFDMPERDGRVQLCYAGDAYSRVMTLRATPEQRAAAVLGLTRVECLSPALSPRDVNAWYKASAELLEGMDVAGLPPLTANRIRMRRAGVWAAIAFAETREGRSGQQAGEHALTELAGVVEPALGEDDRAAYSEAAVRVGASRWASAVGAAPAGPLRIATQPGKQGQTCVLLLDKAHDEKAPLFKRCTYGTVWTASASGNKAGTALALAVQPMASWRELWIFRKDSKGGWSVRALPPAVGDPDVGYAEFAGWVPDKPQLLVAREARVGGKWQKSFEVVSLNSLAVLHHSSDPEYLAAFRRWGSPAWKELTVSLR